MAERSSFDRSSLEIPTSPHPAQRSSETHDSNEAPTATKEADPTYDSVVQSDIGINTLLNRLKQSVASAKDFAAFLKKRSSIEEEHAQSLKKLSRVTFESIRRPDSRQGSYSRGSVELTKIQERIADNGIQFGLSLHQMHEDLQELATDKELGRKEWKHKGQSWEKRVADAEAGADKAKSKYSSLAEDYDRARTGERQTGRFGLKGPKSAAQVEEDLLRRMQAADTDYAAKVENAQQLQYELVNSLRPQAIQAIEYLINECDAGLSLQMQKFATFHEKLLLSNGLCINPIKGEGAGQSLREIIQGINNEKDLKDYVSGFASQAGPRANQLKYEPHRALQPTTQQQPPVQQQQQFQASNPGFQSSGGFQSSSGGIQQPGAGYPQGPGYPPQSQSSQQFRDPMQSQSQPQVQIPGGPNGFQQMQSPSTPTAYNTAPSNSSPYHESPNQYGSQASYPNLQSRDNDHGSHNGMATHTDYGIHNAPPPHPVQQQPYTPAPASPYAAPSPNAPSSRGPTSAQPSGLPASVKPVEQNLPPAKPVFGLSLEDLFARDESAVPMVVSQCIQAVDLFGLNVEGIYRISGNTVHINKLRVLFDNDSSQVDFRNPEAFYHDVNSVAGVLKQFFRDLMDPLFTRQHYQAFIDAARIDDDISRRDSLHAEINNLPDPNYATLRALTLHLYRVQEHSDKNRMNSGNLAICFGPTLMVGSSVPAAIADAGWQVRAIDTILQNAYSIFDED